MREDFLHYIWQQQYFEKKGLTTEQNEAITIQKPGTHNLGAGPDFEGSRIRMDNIQWSGQVEIHLNSSMWNAHKHHRDPVYNGVILHVVWEDDKEVLRSDGTRMPTLVLKDRVDPGLINFYNEFVSIADDFPCNQFIGGVHPMVKMGMIEKSLVERLESKADRVLQLHKDCGEDWDETAYRLLTAYFGFNSNRESFQLLSQMLPLRIIQKNGDSLFKIEALLFGQGGFLAGNSRDSYHQDLKNEYHFLRKKYDLQETVIDKSIWKIGRLRPQNFPTVRISQLAALLYANTRLFESLTGPPTVQRVRHQINAQPSDYWNSHFKFGEESLRKSVSIGRSSTDVLIINTSVPLLAAYSKFTDDQQYMNRAISYLQVVKPESNSILSKWKKMNVLSESAADSQGLIQLFDSYCLKKRCLWCNIGNSILNRRIQPHG